VKHHCAICDRAREVDDMTLFKVKESETKALSKMSDEEPPTEVALCKPCASLMSNRETAVQLIRGTLIAGFRTSGVSISRAEAAADAFCKKLVAATPSTNPV
jgi:hypothetical protein